MNRKNRRRVELFHRYPSSFLLAAELCSRMRM
jgi:hypothetical protein